MFFKKEKSYKDFWSEYEEQTGEKILNRSMGKYISGWEDFDKNNWGGLWGLIITTSGGFRFHHFPKNTWIDSFTKFAEKQKPKEKTIFIPNDKIVSKDLIKETKWWKRMFTSSPPRMVIKYVDDSGGEKQAVFEAEYSG